MNRRTLLGFCTAAVSSGCLGFTGPPRKEFVWIHLENNRDKPHDGELVIERDGDEVFSDQYHLGTGSENATIG